MSLNILLSILFLDLVWCKVQLIHELPSYFPQCYRNDPDLNQCLLKATESVRPYMKQGIPELRIPSFEPFSVPEIVLEQGTQSLNFKAVLKNVVIHGITNYHFTRFDFDVPNLQFFCDADIDNLELDGDYTVHGKVLVAPIEGKGRFTVHVDHCSIKLIQTYHEVEKDNDIYLLPLKSNTSITVSGPRTKLDGLFDENSNLGEVTNKAINDNIDELFSELKPVIEQTISKIMEDVLLKSLMGRVPYNKLYPFK
ncbi:protein takeout-like [Sitophilus oryzae]|uniref:Protein takeout-like n=1 Tax=Sitophilus oryzae TaxID=7048 RepID=A0A6J2YTS9_SITOR|nr:protein takeout-like [Sitophilus oryzae]